jgi:chemotaxis-related protein WspD
MSKSVSKQAAKAAPVIVDCWNHIGVYGDGSCPKLPPHIHCRNCPVYSAAAAHVFDMERPSDGLDEVTRLFSGNKLDVGRAEHSVFIFRIGCEWLALPTKVLDEVTDLRVIHSLPHRRSGVVLGLANVRGELLVCVSLEQLLGVEPLSVSKQQAQLLATRRLLVVRQAAERLAFPVDEVHGTQRYADHELKPAPSTVAKSAATYSKAILAWRDRTVGLLDEGLLFHSLNRSLA